MKHALVRQPGQIGNRSIRFNKNSSRRLSAGRPRHQTLGHKIVRKKRLQDARIIATIKPNLNNQILNAAMAINIEFHSTPRGGWAEDFFPLPKHSLALSRSGAPIES